MSNFRFKISEGPESGTIYTQTYLRTGGSSINLIAKQFNSANVTSTRQGGRRTDTPIFHNADAAAVTVSRGAISDTRQTFIHIHQ